MKKTLFLLLLLLLLLTASGCRRRTTTAAPIPQSVADAQPLGDDSPSRAAPQTSSPDADPDSETVENPDSPRREYDENAAAGIITDDTLDTRLELQREWFTRHSGLTVE